MNKQTLENILKFMQRVDLKGAEVPAFIECINELTNELKCEQKQEVV